MKVTNRIDTHNNPRPCAVCNHMLGMHGCCITGCSCKVYSPWSGKADSRAPLELAEARARELANMISEKVPEGWGFGLVLFTYGARDGFVSWLSSGQRDDMAKALRELLARWEKDEPSI